MNVLALETSSDRGEVALQCGDEILTAELAAVREQSARIVPAIDGLLARAGISLEALDAIAFGRGPGSFTGARLAASVAQGLAMAADLGIVAVSSLAALAQQVARRERIPRTLVCIDARMGEVYWGEYAVDAGVAAAIGRERLSSPTAVTCPAVSPWAAAGNGFDRFGDVLAEPLRRAALTRADWVPAAVDLLPAARAALALGQALAAEQVAPLYLREQTAWETHD